MIEGTRNQDQAPGKGEIPAKLGEWVVDPASDQDTLVVYSPILRKESHMFSVVSKNLHLIEESSRRHTLRYSEEHKVLIPINTLYFRRFYMVEKTDSDGGCMNADLSVIGWECVMNLIHEVAVEDISVDEVSKGIEEGSGEGDGNV